MIGQKKLVNQRATFETKLMNDHRKNLRGITKTELIWDGKYEKDGKRVAPLRVALPFQTVETVNESAQEGQKNLLFESREAYGGKSRNRLIWGDSRHFDPSVSTVVLNFLLR